MSTRKSSFIGCSGQLIRVNDFVSFYFYDQGGQFRFGTVKRILNKVAIIEEFCYKNTLRKVSFNEISKTSF